MLLEGPAAWQAAVDNDAMLCKLAAAVHNDAMLCKLAFVNERHTVQRTHFIGQEMPDLCHDEHQLVSPLHLVACHLS